MWKLQKFDLLRFWLCRVLRGQNLPLLLLSDDLGPVVRWKPSFIGVLDDLGIHVEVDGVLLDDLL